MACVCPSLTVLSLQAHPEYKSKTLAPAPSREYLNPNTSTQTNSFIVLGLVAASSGCLDEIIEAAHQKQNSTNGVSDVTNF